MNQRESYSIIPDTSMPIEPFPIGRRSRKIVLAQFLGFLVTFVVVLAVLFHFNSSSRAVKSHSEDLELPDKKDKDLEENKALGKVYSQLTEHKQDKVIPLSYDLKLSICKEKLPKYLLEVQITCYIVSPVKKISLDFEAPKAEIKLVTISDFVAASKKINFVISDQNLVLEFPEGLAADSLLSIHLCLENDISSSMTGFYSSLASSGAPIYSTQFEPNYARQVFPLFDQPHLKAVFTMEITTTKEFKVLFNTPLDFKTEKDEVRQHVFLPTPRMSPYLLAWVVAKLESKSLELSTRPSLEISVYASEEAVDRVGFALHSAEECVAFYEELLDVSYVLEKLDMVAIPNFEAGAMENWGLVTYREADLLIKEPRFYQPATRRVFQVVAHELAHQWFGNLVTAKGWNQLWLNEGFASFFEAYSLCKLHSEEGDWDGAGNYCRGLVTEGMYSALYYDASKLTDALLQPVSDEEAKRVFSPISYSKGHAVLNMLREFLGEQTFFDGLRTYLKRFSFRSVGWEELNSSLSKQLKERTRFGDGQVLLRDFLQSFVEQKGVPQLFYELDSDSENIRLTQTRFFLLQSEREDTVWQLPVRLQVVSVDGELEQQDFLLQEKVQEFPLSEAVSRLLNKKNCVLVFNPDSAFYHTTFVRTEDVAAFVAAYASLSTNQKFSFLASLSAMFSAAQLDLFLVPNLVPLLKKENNRLVFGTLLGMCDTIYEFKKKYGGLPQLDIRESLEKTLLSKIAELSAVDFDALSHDEQKENTDLLKKRVFLQLVDMGEKGVIEKLLSELPVSDDFDFHEYALHFKTALRFANNKGEVYQRLLKLYLESDLEYRYKVSILGLLGNLTETYYVEKTLELMMSDKVKDQDRAYVLYGVLASQEPKAIHQALVFVKENWSVLAEIYKHGNMLSGFLSAFGSYDEDTFRDFVLSVKKERPLLEKVADRTIERMDHGKQQKKYWLKQNNN